MTRISLSTPELDLVLRSDRERLRICRYGTGRRSWLHPAEPAGLFAATIDGERHDARDLRLHEIGLEPAPAGIRHLVARLGTPDFEIHHHVQAYEGSALIELWQVVRNLGARALRVTRLDSFSWTLPADRYELLHYASDWGREFEPVREPLAGVVHLETRSGRSSKGQHPWFALFRGAGEVLSGSLAWSGNWTFRFEPLPDGGYHLSGGLHDWRFVKDLRSGEAMESPRAILVLGEGLDAVAQQYARVGRRHWYPRNASSASLPVEWNHWFGYEDSRIDEETFRANAQAAAEMGFEVCTLDAGWFGPGGTPASWHALRGDWDTVNRERFPRGIRALAEDVHARHMRFGLWCEIEGLGGRARLGEAHPEFPAAREGAPLGYVCMGNREAREWAYETLCRLVADHGCDWIKLDFNVDPGAGCDRTDHGHGAGDGLYEHVGGYYELLERLRQRFPDVVLESCSSGGLRIDLGILRRTHLTFLSDLDWPAHALQVFWGATTMIAPETCLHWSFSEWVGSGHQPPQSFDPRDPRLQPHQLDCYNRIAMLGAYGQSQKLPELPAWVKARLTDHIRIYKDHVRRFVRAADLYRLTAQPRRDGSGDRWCAFQYSLPDRSEHLLFGFRLPGGEAERAIRLTGLDPDRIYRIEGFEGERRDPAPGRDLMDRGILFGDLPEEGSALLRLS